VHVAATGAVSKIVDRQFFFDPFGSFSLRTVAYHTIASAQLIRKYNDSFETF
jgi:hypothetical protein